MKLSIKFKIMILVSILMCILIVVLVLILNTKIKEPLIEALKKKGEALTINLAANSEEAILTGDEMLMSIHIDKLLQDKSVIYAMLIGKNGEIIVHSDQSIKKGKILSDLISENIKNSNKLLVQYFKKEKEGIYDMSMPIYVENKKLGIARVGFSDKEINWTIEYIQDLIITVTCAVLILGIVVSLGAVTYIMHPLKMLANGVKKIGEGNLDAKISISSGDEIEDLSNVFNDMIVKLKKAQLDMIEKEILGKEIQIARGIQTTLLPKECPQIDGYEFKTLYKSAKEVGGDYYDFIFLDSNRIAIVIADVAGKGIPGSLVMATARSILRSNVRYSVNPSKVLSKTNTIFYDDVRRGMFVTMLYAILDVAKMTLTFANAGHSPVLLLNSNGECKEIGKSGLALGFDRGPLFDKAIKDWTITLKPDDILVFYTDGVHEAMNKIKEEFGQDRLIELLIKERGNKISDIIEKLESEIKKWAGDSSQNDDITVVAFKCLDLTKNQKLKILQEERKDILGQKLELKIKSNAMYLGAVRQFIGDIAHKEGFDEETISNITLASDEAVANIIEHAYSFIPENDINISVWSDEDKFVIIMIDTGESLSPDLSVMPNDDDLAQLKRRGRGRYIIYQLMDEVKYEINTGEGNKLTLVKHKKHILEG